VHAQVENFKDGQLDTFNELFFEATKKKLTNNEEAAIDLFNKSLNIAPKNALAQVHHELSRLYHQVGNTEKAFYHGEMCIELDPNNPWFFISLSENYRDNHLYQKEAETLHRLWPLMDYDLSIMNQTAQAYENANDFKNCLKVLEAIEKRVGFDSDIIEMRVRIYLKQNKPKKAEKELKRITQIDSNFIHKIRLYRFYSGNGKQKKGIKYLTKIQKRNPESAQLNLELAEYYRQKGDEKQFLKYLIYALKSEDLNEEVRVEIINSLFHITQNYPEFLNESYKILEKAEEFHPQSGEIKALYGNFLLRENKLELASKKYLEALKYLQLKDKEIYNQTLFILMEIGEYDKALDVALEAVAYDKDNEVAYLFAGIVLGHQKKHEQAIQILQEINSKAFINKNVKEQILINLAENYHRSGQFDSSDNYFDKVLEINPENYLVLNNYAYYLSIRNDKLDKAQVMAEKVINKFPDNPTYLDTFAWILYMKSDYKKSLKIMEQVIQLNPNSEEIWNHYGDILIKNNLKTQAIKAWRQAQTLGNTSTELQNKINQYEN